MGHLQQSVPQDGRVHLLGIEIFVPDYRVCPAISGLCSRRGVLEFGQTLPNSFALTVFVYVGQAQLKNAPSLDGRFSGGFGRGKTVP